VVGIPCSISGTTRDYGGRYRNIQESWLVVKSFEL
jgi:hypothetical protein